MVKGVGWRRACDEIAMAQCAMSFLTAGTGNVEWLQRIGSCFALLGDGGNKMDEIWLMVNRVSAVNSMIYHYRAFSMR